MICIIDYGVGNLASIQNMLKRIGFESKISSHENDVVVAQKIILPGVGAFDTCATQLQRSGLVNCLTQKVIAEKTPLLGVCVGMQLLLEGSEEGSLPGLGWIKGTNVKFRQEKMPNGYKIPHMGWTNVVMTKKSKLIMELETESRFYFVHSYHARLVDQQDAVLTSDYGYSFVAAVERNNILGVQFHPEKSHQFGMKLLRNFVKNY
ncbi:imidazole glycerol phosphate synthase subunit HisH 2 [Cytophagales bacterium WSM2-2]|nr:imidazole glycerol phosphate synthase subunit HisH 2 [Cytophagales bacterium WSM2-2]